MKPFEGFAIQRQKMTKIPLIWAHFAPNLDIAVCAPIWKKLTKLTQVNINMSPSKRSSGSGKPITASPSAIPNFSKPTTSNPLPKRYPLSQRKHTGGPRALPLPLPLTLTGQSARTQIHTLLSKHTKQAKAKQLQAHWGGNCKPLPIPFETLIRSNGSDHKLLQHHFWHCGMQSPMQKKTDTPWQTHVSLLLHWL